MLTDTNLLQDSQGKQKPPFFLIDFKPLKRLPKFDTLKKIKPFKQLAHDREIYETHTSVMQKACEDINNDNLYKKELNYVPFWINSHSIKIPLVDSPEDYRFGLVIEFLRSKHKEMNDIEQKLLRTLSILVADTNSQNSKDRNKGILIQSITYILTAKFPQNFRIIGGCMPAKDRMMAVFNITLITIQLYHIKGNLDFIDKNGRIIHDKLNEDDINFLKAHVTNRLGYNILSYMAIGKFNNLTLRIR